jgi:acetolactate synthase I/II/III large subunit
MQQKLNTAHALVQALIGQGIDVLYCLPGVQNDPFFDALYHHRDRLRTVHARHEQGAAYMALGAALATGQPQAFCVVPGPGFLNAGAALATAYATNSRVLALVGQVPSGAIGRGFGMLHELPDQLAMLRGLCKWAERVSGAREAVALAAEAFRQMASGRPRPAGLEVPMDVWAREADVEMLKPAPAPEPQIDDQLITAAARLLGSAERPLILVGGGALDASAEIRAVAELLQAPVGTYRAGRGVLDSRHPLSVNLPLAHRLWASADAVLAVGTRLQQPQQVWGLDDGLKIVRIDADPDEPSRFRPPAVGIAAKAVPALRKLLDALPRYHRKRASREDETAALKQAHARELAQRLGPQIAFLDAIRAALPEDGIFVDELTQIGYVSRLALPVYRPRSFLSSGYQGTLGWGLPAALGAKLARPQAPVLSVAGDGGFLFNAQELASAVRHRVAVVSVVFNDGHYGNVRMFQEQNFGGRVIAADLANPDFAKLAESFGVAGMRADSPKALREALERAFALDAPAVVEVRCAEMPSPWPYIQLPRCRPSAAPAAR